MSVYFSTPPNKTADTMSDDESDIEIDVEEIEDSETPFYLRESPVYKAYIREVRRREEEIAYEKLTGQKKATTGESAEQPAKKVTKWTVKTLNLNSWRENNQDNNNIYHMREDTLITNGPKKSKKSAFKIKYNNQCIPTESTGDKTRPRSNTGIKLERAYIDTIQRNLRTSVRPGSKHVLAQTMKEYHRPVTHLSVGSYGYPSRPSTRVEVQTVNIHKMCKSAVGYARSTSGSPCKQSRPGAKSEFCDVLGPVSCQRCIESVNRHMASDLQDQMYPVDCTTSKLVGPTLLKLMTDPRYKAMDSNTIVARRGPKRSKTSQSMPDKFSRDTPTPIKLPVLEFGKQNQVRQSSGSKRDSAGQDGYLKGVSMMNKQKQTGRRNAVVFRAKSS